MAAPKLKDRVARACDGCKQPFNEPVIQSLVPFGPDGKPMEPVYCERCEEAALLAGNGAQEDDACTPDRLSALADTLLDLTNEVTHLENALRKSGKSLFVGRKNLETAYQNAVILVNEEREG